MFKAPLSQTQEDFVADIPDCLTQSFDPRLEIHHIKP